MAVLLDHGSRSPTFPPLGDEGGSYILLRDVLEVRRGHFPARLVSLTFEPTEPDDCLVVDQRAIRQHHFTRAERWASYPAISEAFAQLKARGSRRRPFTDDAVFAPVKIVLAEGDEPIRAVLTFEPFYPTR